MTSLEQLDLFARTKEEQEDLRYQILHTRLEKVRKGIYARHNELAKAYVELNDRLNILERHICRPEKKEQFLCCSPKDNQ